LLRWPIYIFNLVYLEQFCQGKLNLQEKNLTYLTDWTEVCY